MKVLHLNTYDDAGGAARAAFRLHRKLPDLGIGSDMLVQTKTTGDPSVIAPRSRIQRGISLIRPALEEIPLFPYGKRNTPIFSAQWVPDSVSGKLENIAPDIVNLHWICHGLLRIESIARFGRPVVWTMHDSWPFTGGCHLPFDCVRYTVACGRCPQLGSSKSNDLSARVWKRKADAWRGTGITLVAPSRWLAGCARASSLFRDSRIEVIPNGLNLRSYKPVDRKCARSLLNLPQDKFLLLFGVPTTLQDRNKGFHHLVSALEEIRRSGSGEGIGLAVFGTSDPAVREIAGFDTHVLGRLRDDVSLALAYAASDVFVAPSIQENLPNSVMESLSCGTPVVAFRIGGMPDMIEDRRNGYLADPFDATDLARGITWVLADAERHRALCDASREKAVHEFDVELQARRYASLYRELLPDA